MKHLLTLVWLAAVSVLPFSQAAQAEHREIDALVAKHAKANAVPETLVHRIIVRESRYQRDLVGRGGTIGLMQIKLATARGLGYAGDAEGLRDPNTNLIYGVKYLAGAYRVAEGDHDRAVHYYAAGYYEAAKKQRLARLRHPEPMLASAPPKEDVKEDVKPEEVAKSEEAAKPEEVAKTEDVATSEQAAKPAESIAPKPAATSHKDSAKPHTATAKPKSQPGKKLADAKAQVPRPPASIPGGAKATTPR
jgi:hypothetical protein